MAPKEFVTTVQERGKGRKTIELVKEIRDDFKVGDHVSVTVRKLK